MHYKVFYGNYEEEPVNTPETAVELPVEEIEEPQEIELLEEEIRYLNDIIENKRRIVTFEK